VYEWKPNKLRESLIAWEISREGKGNIKIQRDDYTRYFNANEEEIEALKEKDCQNTIEVHILKTQILKKELESSKAIERLQHSLAENRYANLGRASENEVTALHREIEAQKTIGEFTGLQKELDAQKKISELQKSGLEKELDAQKKISELQKSFFDQYTSVLLGSKQEKRQEKLEKRKRQVEVEDRMYQREEEDAKRRYDLQVKEDERRHEIILRTLDADAKDLTAIEIYKNRIFSRNEN
jgi:hypothetical protein